MNILEKTELITSILNIFRFLQVMNIDLIFKNPWKKHQKRRRRRKAIPECYGFQVNAVSG